MTIADVVATSSRSRAKSDPGQAPSKTALLAFAASHLTSGDATALVRRLVAQRRVALSAGQAEVTDLAEIVSDHMDESAATACLQELRRRHEMALPLVPRWA